MKFGLLFRPQDPPNAEHIGQRWQEILAAGQVAEEAGWDGLFVPEHHMMPDAYLESPWPALGALAAVTERVDISTTVHLRRGYRRRHERDRTVLPHIQPSPHAGPYV